MADLDPQALHSRGLTPADVSHALLKQNVILPSGDVKIGRRDYMLTMNNSPDVIDSINGFPIKQVDGRTIFMRDVAHVHDGFQVQTNSVAVDGTPGALMTIRKTGCPDAGRQRVARRPPRRRARVSRRHGATDRKSTCSYAGK
jgi:multidrug efflux pump subunit AcrB